MKTRTNRNGQAPKAAVTFALALAISLCGCGPDPQSPLAGVNSPPAATQETPATAQLSQLCEEGLAALEAGELEKADRLAYEAMTREPDDPESIFLLAFVLAEQNRFAEAIKRLEDLVDTVPGARQTVMSQTAEWMVEQGRWIDAEERCFQILGERPNAVAVHRLLVQLYTRQGRRLEAARHLRHLCRLGNIGEQELHGLLRTFYSFSYDPDEEQYEPIGDLGEVHYMLCAGDVDEAKARLNQLPNRNAAESALLGRIMAEKREFDQLAQWAAEVPDSAKITSDYWFAMGVHQAQQGDHVEAIKSLCAAVARDHTDSQAYVWLNRSLEAINAETEAAEAAARAELINLSKRISGELSATRPPNPQQIVQLIDILDLLQRPFEALSWRVVLLAYSDVGMPQAEVQQMISQINNQRLQLLQRKEPMPPRAFVLCGITPDLLQAAEAEDEE